MRQRIFSTINLAVFAALFAASVWPAYEFALRMGSDPRAIKAFVGTITPMPLYLAFALLAVPLFFRRSRAVLWTRRLCFVQLALAGWQIYRGAMGLMHLRYRREMFLSQPDGEDVYVMLFASAFLSLVFDLLLCLYVAVQVRLLKRVEKDPEPVDAEEFDIAATPPSPSS